MPRSRALPIFTLRQLVSASCSSTRATLAFLVARDSRTGFFISAVYISISSTVRLSSRVSALRRSNSAQPDSWTWITTPAQQRMLLRHCACQQTPEEGSELL